MSAEKAVWLEGFYPPMMDTFTDWHQQWSMGPHADADWVWFKGDYYTEAEARVVLESKPDGIKGDD
jgi:hypothetical protein